jgi:hypothetical protein
VPRTRSLEESFWLKTDKRGADECWPWLGKKNQKGYGELTRRKPEGGKRIIHKATRLSWSIANGQPFPENRLACHRCDNPPCVNPNHIWPGTPRENTQDMLAKGRRPGVERGSLPIPATCGRGHDLFVNLYFDTNNNRRCRECSRAAARRSWSNLAPQRERRNLSA